MILSENELFKGKSCVIKNKSYFQTKDYINSFKDKVKDIVKEFCYEAIAPDHITKDNDVLDASFTRVLVYATLNKKQEVEGYSEVLSLVYTLDGRKPLYKVIRGFLKEGTTNLYVFDPNWMIAYELEPDKEMYINVKQLLELESNFANNMTLLMTTEIKRVSLCGMFGNWVDRCLTSSYDNGFHSVKMSSKDIVDVYTSLFVSNKSNKFIALDKKITLFDIYKEMIEIISDDDKDIVNRFEKTILLNKILNG